TVHAERNGQPAPAAGWIEALMWREGKGLMARVTWTDRATAMIRSGEYKYISPTFSFDPKSGRVTQLHHAGLTNNPALPGLGEVAARMGRIHPDSKEKPLSTQKIAQALGLEPDADETAILSAIKARTEVKTTAPVPDPATHVPLEAVKEMQAEIAALKSRVVQAEVNAVVTQSLANGRLPKGLESWARSLGASNMVALNAFLDQAQPVAALTAMQTGGKGPEATSQPTLDATELAVCTALGVDSKDFVATKASLKGEG
ncbi:MAG: hypothetical protein HQM03_22080, partial [Magnetococcales bacterium]|nr:hypothetical protein [Magnetococcales bacterium]